MGIEFLLIAKWYAVIGLAFVITSLFTLHFPSWAIVKEWAAENMPNKIPTSGYIFGHTVAFMLVSFVVYPVMAAALLTSNKEAVRGYSKALIKSIIEEDKNDSV